MTKIEIKNNSIKVVITKKQVVNYYHAKKLITKGKRIINQQQIKSATIHIDSTCKIDAKALNYFNNTIEKTKEFPVKIINT